MRFLDFDLLLMLTLYFLILIAAEFVFCVFGVRRDVTSLGVTLCFGVLMVGLWSKLLGILCEGCLLC